MAVKLPSDNCVYVHKRMLLQILVEEASFCIGQK